MLVHSVFWRYHQPFLYMVGIFSLAHLEAQVEFKKKLEL